jgi:NADPH-dependent glutamate synthase beta subunit-like oxidoreductase
MVHIGQIVLGLLATSSPGPQLHHGLTSQPNVVPTAGKSIAIVGAGGAGLAALDTLLQYKAAHQANWTITLFEQRHDVGGVWRVSLPFYFGEPTHS